MDWINTLLIPLIVTFAIAVGVLACGAYVTVFERKLCGRFQVRYGPNRAFKFGLLQPIADAIKAFMKEEIVPKCVSSKWIYILAPGIAFAAVVITFGVIPIGQTWNVFGYDVRLQIADIDVGLIYVMAIAGLGAYGIVLGGWSSNNKYSLLGALRATAQMISYELPMGLALASVALIVGSLRMSDLVSFQSAWPLIILQPVGFLIYLISGIAENNRSPFDMPETENELISGHITEYGGIKFALFFIAEYANMVVISSIVVTVFLGGWQWPAFLANIHPLVSVGVFFAKVWAMLFLYVWIRASLPRVRFDKLMRFSWKFLFPLGLLNLAVTAVIVALAA